MLKYAIFLGFVVVCWAQTPTPCESPKEWEGRRVRRDREKQYMRIEKYTYDETNRRTRAIEMVTQGQERQFLDVLRLHNQNKEYVLDLKTRKCNVSTPRYPFRPKGVPPGSKFLFESEVGPSGIPGEHLTVTNWEGTFDDGVKYMTAVTSPDCVPVWVGTYSKDNGFEVESYFDIVAGIPDPSVFIPPSECTA